MPTGEGGEVTKLYHVDVGLVLRVHVREGDPEWFITLKKALKCLLRSFGIECRSFFRPDGKPSEGMAALPATADGATDR